MRVLLIGAYGFIGSALVRALIDAGHQVTGLGRSVATGRRIFPDIDWIAGDLNHLTDPTDWAPHLADVDAVVNASGALQSGAGDSLADSQARAIAALIQACETLGVTRFVQISAPGATPDADTEFMRTKATADARLQRASLDWAILRPGLVIARNAYGGTALIRSLAALPLIQCSVHGAHRVQTVAMDDVAAAVLHCLDRGGGGREADLVAPEAHSLATVILRHRAWLGFAPPRAAIDLPGWLARPVGWIADGLGHLRWRSPLRSTALRLIAADVVGDADQTRALLGREPLSLDATLARHPAGVQDRWHARLTLLLPLMILALAGFWLSSGVIGLARSDAAIALLAGSGLGENTVRALVVGGSLADFALGLAILVRPWARIATLGMVLLTLGYLAGGTLLRPDLWLDPLAPLIKTIPAMLLALAVHAMLDER